MNNPRIINRFNVGGSHANNPYGGIPFEDKALTQQGETSMPLEKGNYIFSDNLYVGDVEKQLGIKIPKGYSFSQASEYIESKFEEGGTVDYETKSDIMSKLMKLQEVEKSRNGEDEYAQANSYDKDGTYAMGGNTAHSFTGSDVATASGNTFDTSEYEAKAKRQGIGFTVGKIGAGILAAIPPTSAVGVGALAALSGAEKLAKSNLEQGMATDKAKFDTKENRMNTDLANQEMNLANENMDYRTQTQSRQQPSVYKQGGNTAIKANDGLLIPGYSNSDGIWTKDSNMTWGQNSESDVVTEPVEKNWFTGEGNGDKMTGAEILGMAGKYAIGGGFNLAAMIANKKNPPNPRYPVGSQRNPSPTNFRETLNAINRSASSSRYAKGQSGTGSGAENYQAIASIHNASSNSAGRAYEQQQLIGNRERLATDRYNLEVDSINAKNSMFVDDLDLQDSTRNEDQEYMYGAAGTSNVLAGLQDMTNYGTGQRDIRSQSDLAKSNALLYAEVDRLKAELSSLGK